MTKVFEKKVIKQGIIDTKKYRYVYREDTRNERMVIERLPLEYLDTTKAINNWETVKEYK